MVLAAVIAMARTLAPDLPRLLIAGCGQCGARSSCRARWARLATILAAGTIGAIGFRGSVRALPLTCGSPIGRRAARRERASASRSRLLVGLPVAAELRCRPTPSS